jgi:flagellar export protein FliJ
MKRFVFSLRAVRELRVREEEAAQKAFAEAMRQRDEARQRCADNEQHWVEACQLARYDAQNLSVEQVRRAREWCRALEDKQRRLNGELDKRQRGVDAAHAALLSATRLREGIDKLFEKQRAAHEREALREQQNILDEMATRTAWQGNSTLEAA